MQKVRLLNKFIYFISVIVFPIILFLAANRVVSKKVLSSEDVSISATVDVPSFSVDPYEDPASTSTSPTNVGVNVTFKATGTDPMSDQYYLAVCKTNTITAGNNAAPTCTGGAWCISNATNSGSEATCSHITLAGDNESENWYAFICDKVSGSGNCSASSQGSGDSGSPFKVNHQPSFSGVSDNGPKNPGQTVTFTSTASDSDVDGTSDTVKLVICKTSGTSGSDCDGGESDRYCQSSFTSFNPTCDYEVPVPTRDQSYTYYAYIFDNHDLIASSTHSDSFNVNNVAPFVSNVTLNGGSDITLTENTTTNITLTATVTDNNSCQDISSVVGSLYRSGIGYSSCDESGKANNNNCYPVVSCSVVGSGNTCSGSNDVSADYTCTAAVQFHTDPTDASTLYPTENWLDTVKATDDNSASHSLEVSIGVELLSLTAMDVTASINYGALPAGTDTGSTNQTTVVTATGNVGLDEDLSGVIMTYGVYSIPVNNQHYALTAFTYGTGDTSLSATPTEAELNCKKTTVTLSKETKNTYWGIAIPSTGASGLYTGTNTITAVKGETTDW
jgi:hypothetical protein